MDKVSDQKLIELIRDSGSRNYGFNLMVMQYRQPVYYHIRRMVIDHEDADDLVQETFYKAWKYIDSFREEARLFTWIYRIATNEALLFLRKKKRTSLLSLSFYEHKLADKLEAGSGFSGNEIQKKLHKAILKLPDKQRLVFNLKYFDELKYEEISEIVGTSVGALKASFHIATKKIENYLLND